MAGANSRGRLRRRRGYLNARPLTDEEFGDNGLKRCVTGSYSGELQKIIGGASNFLRWASYR